MPFARAAGPSGGGGGAPARRAMSRWAWRLFRREWRRQALVLGLLIVAVAATTIGLGVASNLSQPKADPAFGTANTIIVLPGHDTEVLADIAALRSRFGTIEPISHQDVPVPGSVTPLDVRAQSPHGPYGSVMLRLDAGRYPSGADEVALTKNAARIFGLRVGGVWHEGGRSLRVVGLVENPLNFLDQFALVAPGQANPPTDISVLVDANPQSLQSLNLPSRSPVSIESRGTGNNKAGAEAMVLVLGTLGLLFVGLMAVAGFTVMAQRRMRAMGMLGAIGATDRHVRTVMLANGAVVGACAAAVGTVVGLGAWFAFVPGLESISGHRIDGFALPWWAIGAAMFLAFVTAVGAAWWPARAVARVPVVAALSGRPPRPQPAHRFAAAGGALLAAGLVLLTFADRQRAGFIIGGTVSTVLGLLFLAPLAIRALATLGRHSPISVRLAVRDLARYQARSGSALGAVTLAVGIAATIALSAAAASAPTAAGNLPANQLNIYVTPPATGNPIPPLTPAQRRAAQGSVNQLAAGLKAAAVVPVEQAFDPRFGTQLGPPGPGGSHKGYPTATLSQVTVTPQGEDVSMGDDLYVATPTLLAHFGIKPSEVNPNADVLTSQNGLGGLQIFDPGAFAGPTGPGPTGGTRPPGSLRGRGPVRPKPVPGATHPDIQTLSQLPAYSSDPTTLITMHAMKALGLKAIPSGWLVQTSQALTTAEVDSAQKAAATAGLYVEAMKPQTSLAQLRDWSTTVGILLALGVLGMTVGLIRSETANDLRALAATGASSSTRRSLTAATAGALALLGALMGTAGAYLALVAWYRSNLTALSHVPVGNIAAIVVGLPLVATAGGWLLAGRQPPGLGLTPGLIGH